MTTEEIIDAAEWVEVAQPDNEGVGDAEFYQGLSGKWTINVVSFDLEPQGFPPGTRGHDGAMAGSSTVVRLTREQAERAFKLAKSA